ncbi:MAG: hypothetical protein AB7F96_00125 [Beijerinckiaceae bacterium]
MSKIVYRADHGGSLVRPQALRDARLAYRRGSLSAEELERAEDDAILAAIDLQKQVGMPIFSDGEFRRDFWLSAVSEEYFEGLTNEGMDLVKHPFLKGKAIENSDILVPPNPIATGKLARRKRITDREAAFLKANSPGPYKLTLPSPVTLAPTAYRKGVSDRVYSSWHDLFAAYTDLVAEEVRDMARDGVAYLQLDAPHYARYLLPDRRASLRKFDIDFDEELDVSIKAENKCLAAGSGPGRVTAVHICLGTFILGAQGPLGGAGAYESELLGRMIGELNADVFLIEFSERTGGADALRHIPANKNICLGIPNTRDPQVEAVDFIQRRVEEAAKHVSVDCLSISPNCGFSGGAARTWIDEETQKRKLANVVEAAERIWGRVVEP